MAWRLRVYFAMSNYSVCTIVHRALKTNWLKSHYHADSACRIVSVIGLFCGENAGAAIASQSAEPKRRGERGRERDRQTDREK